MPGSKTNRNVTSQRSSTSVTVVRSSKQVVESFSSATGIKTVSHKRLSDGKTLTTWSSPSMLLTSPQSWVSGSEATFFSPKSPSPKMRITRRSSIYVSKSGPQKVKSKSVPAPKGITEFKIPVTSVAISSKTAKSGRSSVSQMASNLTTGTTSRRSSVYSRKAKGPTMAEMESKPASPKVEKSKVSPPEGKKVKSPKASTSGKKGKLPTSVTRSRKRNVSEVEEASPEKPVAKRSRQQMTDVSSPSPKKAKKPSSKKTKETTALNHSQDGQDKEEVSSPSSPPQSVRKSAKKAVCKAPATRLPRSKGRQEKSSKSAQAAEENDDDHQGEDEVDLTSSSEKNTSRGRKRKSEIDTPKDTPKTKSLKSSPKSTSSKKASTSSKKSSKKSSTAKKSARKTPAKTPKTPAVKVLLFGSEKTTEETPSKIKGRTGELKSKASKPKSALKSKEMTTKPATPKSSAKKSASRVRTRRGKESTQGTSPATKEEETANASEESKTTTPKSQEKSQSKTQKSLSLSRSANKSAKKTSTNSTPKASQKSGKKSLEKSSKKKTPSVSRSVKKSAKKNEKLDDSDALDGSYLQVSAKQKKSSTSKSKKPTPLISKVARSDEDERILEILRNAVNSTPKAGNALTPKSTAKSKKLVPKRLQSSIKHATPERAKSVKIAATPKSSQRSSSSASRVTTSYRKTPRIIVTKTGTPQSARNSQLSTRNHARETVGTPRAARNVQSLSGGEYAVGQTSYGLQTLGRRSQVLSPSSLNSLHGQSYHEEKSFMHYEERRSGGGVERFGAAAVEHRLGENSHRSGSYLIHQEKAAIKRAEEGEWQEEDGANDSCLSASDDLNSTISTSTESSRCTIL